MFGHRKRKNINTIRKEVTRIRRLEEEKAGKPGNKMTPGGFVVFLIIMVIMAYSQFASKPANDSSFNNSAPGGSSKIIHAKAIERVRNPETRISDNYNMMSRTEMSGPQIESLSKVLNEKNWTLINITRKPNWAKGDRYLITVNKGFDYLVYFNRNSIQSINNMSNQVVYGSRAEY